MADAEPPSRPQRQAVAALGDDCALMAGAGTEAAHLALRFFRGNTRNWRKRDTTVVSEADIAVDRYLRETLLSARPDYAWLSEESAPDKGRGDRTFVIDPIDGTRGFLDGTDNWTISMAVVEAGRPTSAVLMQPTRERMFAAAAGRGAILDDDRLTLRQRPGLLGARVAGSKSFIRAARSRGIEHVPFIHSLALRIALVAAGDIEAAVTTKGANDWDLAAADLILHEAGGKLADLEGEPLVYCRATRHLPIAAASAGLIDEVLAILAETTAAASRH